MRQPVYPEPCCHTKCEHMCTSSFIYTAAWCFTSPVTGNRRILTWTDISTVTLHASQCTWIIQSRPLITSTTAALSNRNKRKMTRSHVRLAIDKQSIYNNISCKWIRMNVHFPRYSFVCYTLVFTVQKGEVRKLSECEVCESESKTRMHHDETWLGVQLDVIVSRRFSFNVDLYDMPMRR